MRRLTVCNSDPSLSPLLEDLPHALLASLATSVDGAPNIDERPASPTKTHPLGRHSSLVLGSGDRQVLGRASKRPGEVLQHILRVPVRLLESKVDVRRVLRLAVWQACGQGVERVGGM